MSTSCGSINSTGAPSAWNVWGRQRRRSTGLTPRRGRGTRKNWEGWHVQPTLTNVNQRYEWWMFKNGPFTWDLPWFTPIDGHLDEQNEVPICGVSGVPSPHWLPTGTSSETWGSWQSPTWTWKILNPINCKVYLPSTNICSWLEICRTCSSRRCNWPAVFGVFLAAEDP